MAKQSRKKLRRPKRRSFRKRNTKKMFGGDFTQEESQQLLGMGFTQDDIQFLAGTNLENMMGLIQTSLNEINPATGAPFTPQELIQSMHEANDEINQLDISGISNASEDDHNLDDGQNLNDSYNDSMNTTGEETNLNDSNVYNGNNNSQDSLHLSDLNVSDDNSSVNTTTEEDSFGGKKRKAYRKTRKVRKGRKGRKYGGKSCRQRGGMCFGNGVGANSYDPNFSIYNTRELTLFPYRPTN